MEQISFGNLRKVLAGKKRLLYLEGDKRGIESITSVKTLERLALRRIKRDNLDFLASLQELSTLRLFYDCFLNQPLKHTADSSKILIKQYAFI